MLSAKWIAFFTFVWLGGAFLGAIIEGAYIGEGERSVLNQLAVWQKIQEEQDWGFWEVVGVVPGFFAGLFNMITFNFAFIRGSDWELYRWIIMGPLITMFVYGLIMTLAGLFSRNVT